MVARLTLERLSMRNNFSVPSKDTNFQNRIPRFLHEVRVDATATHTLQTAVFQMLEAA